MGSLSELRLPRSEVYITDDQTLTVRGLSLADITEVVRDHAEVLNGLYVRHVTSGEDLPSMDVLARALMTEAPEVVARLIANANDEPDAWPIVKTLPGIVQINAIIEIGVLTFHSEAEVKKLMETLIRGSQVLSSLLGIVGDRRLPAA